jgi:hypothetical protein
LVVKNTIAGCINASYLNIAPPVDYTPSSYNLTIDHISDLTASPSANSLGLDDDDSISIFLKGNTFPFCNGGTSVEYTDIFVSSNGYITFDYGSTGYNESVSKHFNQSRISLLYLDLDLRYQSDILSEFINDGCEINAILEVTWILVPEYNKDMPNCMQIRLWLSNSSYPGKIELLYGDLTLSTTEDSIIGLSNGNGFSGTGVSFETDELNRPINDYYREFSTGETVKDILENMRFMFCPEKTILDPFKWSSKFSEYLPRDNDRGITGDRAGDIICGENHLYCATTDYPAGGTGAVWRRTPFLIPIYRF